MSAARACALQIFAARASAIQKLADLPCLPELVGVALDFATDLHCDRATYFGPEHDMCIQLAHCNARPMHQLCVNCSPAHACDNVCGYIVCLTCSAETHDTCTVCKLDIKACNQSSACTPYTFSCCESRRREYAVLCGPCLTRLPHCYICMTSLCRDCNYVRHCSNMECGARITLCDDHRCHPIMAHMWAKCIGCKSTICHPCSQRVDAPGLCTECVNRPRPTKRKALHS